jgi:hypothetical protein
MRPLILTKESNAMKNRLRKPAPAKKAPEGKIIKLRVDSRTVILVRNQTALKMWMDKYPKAEIVSQ